ncbi:ABC-type nitrate/sulfonate/bicarbonate transport system permease component [Prauserella shujinwangii]|uniref:ABC-type nitrate/sulfonate/bicarbonate transport system permease component n=1 Tax=Prauserella shujinwangii TaxID=1453103 RepID=A0A2T0LSL6_9PSEU|nr:ABC transporter permease subunit [Prauserella shujinwangii]PRX46613.1 ABC-type nitrate/sulfonate/bicarbonate transport system permease component [Prauserella shujinwangii]
MALTQPHRGRAAEHGAALVSVAVRRIGLLVLALAGWELLARILDSRAVPAVAPAFDALVSTVPSGPFWAALGGTLQSWGLGMLLAAGIGLPLGLLIGSSPLAMRATRGVVEFLRTVPAIMLVPLAVLLFGATVEMKVVLITLSAVWPLLVHAAYGIGHVDAVARDSMRAFRLRRRDRVVFLYLPSALPLVATGLRVAATVALLISIGAEIVTSAPGIGYEIALGQANNAAPRSFVYVLLSGLLGVGINLGFGALERRVLFWHASQRARSTA